MTDLYSKVIGCGSYLPEKILTNHDLAKIVDTSHDWIFERTGIEQRHIAHENESSVDMAYKASLKAISMAQLLPNDISIILSNFSTDLLCGICNLFLKASYLSTNHTKAGIIPNFSFQLIFPSLFKIL